MSKKASRETDGQFGRVVAKSAKVGKKSSGGKSPRVESDGKFGKRGK